MALGIFYGTFIFGEAYHMGMVMVGDKYLASGFRLIGIESSEASDDDAAAKKVEEIISEGKCEIVIISETVAIKIKPLRDSLLATKKSCPIFLIIPDFQGPLHERIKELHQLVDQAIGVKLKLE
jgi:vacuolar-type H+-ATPase subunit F/Vma7